MLLHLRIRCRCTCTSGLLAKAGRALGIDFVCFLSWSRVIAAAARVPHDARRVAVIVTVTRLAAEDGAPELMVPAPRRRLALHGSLPEFLKKALLW